MVSEVRRCLWGKCPKKKKKLLCREKYYVLSVCCCNSTCNWKCAYCSSTQVLNVDIEVTPKITKVKLGVLSRHKSMWSINAQNKLLYFFYDTLNMMQGQTNVTSLVRSMCVQNPAVYSNVSFLLTALLAHSLLLCFFCVCVVSGHRVFFFVTCYCHTVLLSFVQLEGWTEPCWKAGCVFSHTTSAEAGS